MSFPKDFAWGAATASYQIEGASDIEGRGRCVWDAYCQADGKVRDGDTGRVACDHYHRYREDVAMMAEMNLKAYRFSISWPRVLPQGTGALNEKGLDFYDKLVDELLAAGIQPWATLFHWDMPMGVFNRGGWLNRDCADWFGDYATIIAKRLGDRVSNWMTLNEPQCFIGLGLQTASHAPGLRYSWADTLRAAHVALLSHGKAVAALRQNCQKTPVIGWAPVGVISAPATDSDADIEAARMQMFGMGDEKTLWVNSVFSDPVVLGKYPDCAVKMFGRDMPEICDGDMETISAPLDFYGANIYNSRTVRMGENGQPEFVDRKIGYACTANGWPVTPEALYWGPRLLHERYGLPIVITENGLASNDWPNEGEDAVNDPARIDFTRRYLKELKRACADGVDIKGYFHWSLMDNFEWSHGYSHRFGLCYVDYPTGRRIIKSSGRWYANTITQNGANL